MIISLYLLFATNLPLSIHGKPALKYDVNNKLSLSFLGLGCVCFVLALIYCMLLLSRQVNLIQYSEFFPSIFAQLLVLPAIYAALSGAAAAGSKRLSSDTYKELNMALILNNGFYVILEVVTPSIQRSVLSSIFQTLFFLVSSVTAVAAYMIGKSYSQEGAILNENKSWKLLNYFRRKN